MHSGINSRRSWILVSVTVVVLTMTGMSGGFSALARAGDASLEFVGHLISVFNPFPSGWPDPTCPQCL